MEQVVGTISRTIAERYRTENPAKLQFTFEIGGFSNGSAGYRSALAPTYMIITAEHRNSAEMILHEMFPNASYKFLSRKSL